MIVTDEGKTKEHEDDAVTRTTAQQTNQTRNISNKQRSKEQHSKQCSKRITFQTNNVPNEQRSKQIIFHIKSVP